MKILHVISGLGENGGGTSEVVPRMCEALKEAGHEVTIMTTNAGEKISSTAERALSAGVCIVFCRRPERSVMLAYSHEFSKKIRSAVMSADIVHLHGLWQWPCWRAARVARKLRKPYVIQTHGFLEPERLKKSRLKKKIIGLLIERENLAAASCVLATAESERQGLIRYGVKRPIEIVPIGIDFELFGNGEKNLELLERLGVPANRKVLLYLSRLTPIKGLDLLAEAWSRLVQYHSDWHLLVVGDDTQGFAERIKSFFTKTVKDGSVSLPGPIYGPGKYALLNSADAFVLPTRSENFSIAVQEALASGMPVVCTKGAPWGMIEGDLGAEELDFSSNGRCGWWVDIDVPSIMQGLQKMMSLSDSERSILGENGRTLVERTFSWQSIAKRLVGIYCDVLDCERGIGT